MRTALAACSCLLAACETIPATRPPLGTPPAQAADAPVAAPVAPPVDEPELDREPQFDERALRESIAAGDENAASSALILADHYAAREAFGYALPVVDAAIASVGPLPELRYAAARLRRDVDRNDDAIAILEPTLTDHPDFARGWALLAEIQFVVGDLDAVERAVAPLRSRLADDPWVRSHLDWLEDFRARVQAARAGAPRSLTARDLFAKLRGRGDHAARKDALSALLGIPDTRARALAIGLSHGEPVVRIQSLRRLAETDVDHAEHVRAALDDPSPKVRGTAARTAARLALGEALLLDRLAVEEDPYTFRCLHDALRRLTGPAVDLAPGGERSADIRRETRHAWRRHWTR